jgi:hypothetical protein
VFHVVLSVHHGLSSKLSSCNAVRIAASSHRTASGSGNVPRIAVYIRVYHNVVNRAILGARQNNRYDIVQPERLGVNPVARARQGLGLIVSLLHKSKLIRIRARGHDPTYICSLKVSPTRRIHSP